MKLSVSAWSVQKDLFSKKTNLYEFIDFCKKNEVDGVELLDCFWEDDAQVIKISEYLEKLNLPVSAYSIANDFVQADEDRTKEVEKVRKGIDLAAKLGAKYLRIFSGEQKEGVAFEQARSWIVDSFKECARYAEQKGIVMVLENHGLFAGKSSQVKGMIDEVASSFLRANTDTGNFMLVGENSLDAIANMKEYVAYVHFKDFRRVEGNGHYVAIDGTEYIGTIIGQGEVQLKEIVELLHANGYDGYLSIEFEGDGDPYSGTEDSIKYLKSVIV